MGVNQKKERWSSVLYMLVTLSIPTIIEEVLATLIQYVDTAMVGQLGEQATGICQREHDSYMAGEQCTPCHRNRCIGADCQGGRKWG